MKTLLVIDPDAGFHAKVKELLKPGQVELVSTDNGSDAVKLAADVQPDMIILNLELQDLNGFLVCSSLKKNPGTREIPLVITSGTKTEADFDQHRKLKFRADSYFRKPMSAKELGSVLIDFLGAGTVQTEKEVPLGTDFDEENIDKLLDSTFTAFSTDGSQSEAALSDEPVEEILEPGSSEKDGEEEAFNLELELREEDEDIAPSVDLSDLEEESGEDVLPESEDVPRVSTGDLELDIDEEPEEPEKKAEPNPVATMPEDAIQINKLKQETQEKAVQIITLQKENEFLKTENRNLLMDLTSLKADIAEREQELAQKKSVLESENTAIKTRLEAIEAELAAAKTSGEEKGRLYEEMEARNLKLEESIDALQKENQGLKGELEQQKAGNEETVAELNRQLIAEEEKARALQKELDECKEKENQLREEFRQKTADFEEKESMLMTTIENLTRNSREMEDELKLSREKLKHLAGILKSAAAEVDAPEE
ncbi:MAG: response regulator [Acidobacteria bacterium]|nr:response regulator [Acidobacteriota bacterium]